MRLHCAPGRLKTCRDHGGEPDACRSQENEIEEARSADKKLTDLFVALAQSGAATDRGIPWEAVQEKGFDKPPRDITTLQFAKMSCPDELVNILLGKRAK